MISKIRNLRIASQGGRTGMRLLAVAKPTSVAFGDIRSHARNTPRSASDSSRLHVRYDEALPVGREGRKSRPIHPPGSSKPGQGCSQLIL
nr:hypothetical protein CFP56_30680 [Quercus suber]